MIMVWGSCLTITLLSVSWVVRRVVQPLDQLNGRLKRVGLCQLPPPSFNFSTAMKAS